MINLALAAVVVVGAAANGTTIGLHRADTLVVRLAGNATTGYRWAPAQVPASLHLVSSRYAAPVQARLGQGGTYVFRFAARAGSGTLVLRYARPWARADALRSFRLTVRVR